MAETVYIIDPNADRRARFAAALAGEPLCVRSYDSACQFLDQSCATASGCVIASAELPAAGTRTLIERFDSAACPSS